MLETPSIRRYSFVSHVLRTVCDMSSQNPSGAVNQQERPGFEQWIVGFVDGEGCFSISLVRNRTSRLGWQVQHEFVVTQSVHSIDALEVLKSYFGCGFVYENERQDNHRWPLARFVVRRRSDLRKRIVPFFEDHPLITAKRDDFRSFRYGSRHDACGRPPLSRGAGDHRRHHGEHEPQTAVSIPGILRGHTPTISKLTCGDEDMVRAP